MDRLELRMGDRRLDDRRQIVTSDEAAEVIEQVRHELGRRRDERRFERVVSIAADPVLALAQDAGDRTVGRRSE